MSDELKNWTEAQRRLWESLSTTLPTFRPPQSLEGWRETYLRNLEAWERSVQQTLQMQAGWVREWAARMSQDYGQPESVGEWSRQVEDVMQHWLDTQTQLWNNWFTMLRSGGETARPQVNVPLNKEESSPKVQHPAPVAEKPATPGKTAPATPKPARKRKTAEPSAPKADSQAPAPAAKGAAQAEPAPAEPVTNQPKARRTTSRKTSTDTSSRSTTSRAKTTRTQSKAKAKAPAPEERPNPAQPGTPDSARLGPAPEAEAEPVVSTPQSPDKAPEEKAADQADQQDKS